MVHLPWGPLSEKCLKLQDVKRKGADGLTDRWILVRPAGKGGCNGGEWRAGKAKWIMRMWGTDETCSITVRTSSSSPCCCGSWQGCGRRDGTCEPRCLHPPSPAPWIENNLCFNASALPLPGLSPLIALAPRMRYVPPRPHPCKLNKTAGFCGSPAATPPLLLVSVLHHSVPPPQH